VTRAGLSITGLALHLMGSIVSTHNLQADPAVIRRHLHLLFDWAPDAIFELRAVHPKSKTCHSTPFRTTEITTGVEAAELRWTPSAGQKPG
jgi:hypothetical protein